MNAIGEKYSDGSVLLAFNGALYVHGGAWCTVLRGCVRVARFTFAAKHGRWRCVAPRTAPALELLCESGSSGNSTDSPPLADSSQQSQPGSARATNDAVDCGERGGDNAEEGDDHRVARFLERAQAIFGSGVALLRLESLTAAGGGELAISDEHDNNRDVLGAWPDQLLVPLGQTNAAPTFADDGKNSEWASLCESFNPPLVICGASASSARAEEHAPPRQALYRWLAESQTPPTVMVVGKGGMGKVCIYYSMFESPFL